MIEVCSLPNRPRRNLAVSVILLFLICGILLILISLKVAFWAAAIAVSTGWVLTSGSGKHFWKAFIISVITGTAMACLIDTMSFRESVLERTSEHIIWSNAAVYAFGSVAGAAIGVFRALKTKTP